MEPGQRLGLSVGMIENTQQQVEGLLVYHVEEGSVLVNRNERCRQRFLRDQLLPGELIVQVGLFWHLNRHQIGRDMYSSSEKTRKMAFA